MLASRMNVKGLTVYSLLTIALVGGSFSFGVGYAQKTFEPQVKLVTRTETQVQTKIEYVDRLVEHYIEKPVEVEVVKEIPRQLNYFISLEELKDWLKKDKTNTLVASYPNFDCDDYAYELQQRAIKDGYIISTELDWKEHEYHMLNSVRIGKDIYFVEPQDDTVSFHVSRD
jgi:hypothetical protein